MKVAIIIGHSPSDKGACNSGFCEFDYNQIVAHSILEQSDLDIEIVYRDDYHSLPDKVNKTGADIAISLHCNAFNKEASGCETLYSGSKKGLELAQKVHAKILPVFGNPDRGIKKRRLKDRGGWILHKTKMPCVILEPFFIDNDEELKKAKRVYKEYAKAIIDAL
jgi:N-acetylmuramoyl-L-alanine amidase